MWIVDTALLFRSLITTDVEIALDGCSTTSKCKYLWFLCCLNNIQSRIHPSFRICMNLPLHSFTRGSYMTIISKSRTGIAARKFPQPTVDQRGWKHLRVKQSNSAKPNSETVDRQPGQWAFERGDTWGLGLSSKADSVMQVGLSHSWGCRKVH